VAPVRFGGVDGGQDDRVIGSDSSGLVHWMRVAALEQDVGLVRTTKKAALSVKT